MRTRKVIKGLIALAVVIIALGIAYQRGLLWKRTIRVQSPDGQPSLCELHGTALRIETIEAPKGQTISLMNGYEEAERKLFPNSNRLDYGGYPRNVGWIERLYCTECRKAADEWSAKKIADGSA